MKIIVQNKKALFDYEIDYTIEAGIVLTGDEVKSIRAGKVSLNGAFATVKDNELYLLNGNISLYSFAYDKNEDHATRSRKLLLSRKQINKLIGEVSRKGMTILPLKIYLNGKGLVKVEIGIGKHRKLHDKRDLLKERDVERQTRREIKQYS